jgi:transposase-like protein
MVSIDDLAIQAIAVRVAGLLREDLESIASGFPGLHTSPEQLTVSEVASRLGVARSTVYAHWREWGGYKLGGGDKSPIRFDSQLLPSAPRKPGGRQPPTHEQTASRQRARSRRRDLLPDTPRLLPQQDRAG